MSNTAKISHSIVLGGKTFKESKSISGEGSTSIEVSVPAAKTGTLTTRTDNNTGTLTMTSGHGITTGARLDVFWDGGCRRGMTVGTVSVNSVPIDLGSGDNLPAATTPVTAMVPVTQVLVIAGDTLMVIALACLARAIFVLAGSDNTEHLGAVIEEGEIYAWDEDSGVTNPVAGDDIAKIFLSHGETSAKVLRVGLLFD